MAHAPSQVTFRRNLRSLSPSRLSSMVSSALPSPSQFSALDTNSATDTLCSTLTSCLDNFCPLSSRPARATPSAPWLSDVLREHRAKLRAAERKWHKSKNSTDLSVYQSHLSSFSANVSTAKMTYYHDKINNCSDSRIAACLSDISSWMMDHHLQLNLAKTELLVFSANPSLHHNFSIQLGSSTITSSRTARNLGVVIDDQLSFTDHIATTARSCRFALYNIRKIRTFLSEQAAQLLVQALVLSRLDYCNALLAGLPACTIKPLQLIQNAAARVVFNEPKKAHVTPLFIRLYWLPIAARIKFKVLMFAYKTTTGTAPIYLNSLVQTYAPSRSLRSASERRLVVPSQRGTKSLSRTFSWTVPSWWNDLPISIRFIPSISV